MKLPPEKFAPKKQGDGGKDLPTEAKKLQLNSAEELYAEIRDKNFNAVGSVLSKKAKVISAAFEVRWFGCYPASARHRLDCPPLLTSKDCQSAATERGCSSPEKPWAQPLEDPRFSFFLFF